MSCALRHGSRDSAAAPGPVCWRGTGAEGGVRGAGERPKRAKLRRGQRLRPTRMCARAPCGCSPPLKVRLHAGVWRRSMYGAGALRAGRLWTRSSLVPSKTISTAPEVARKCPDAVYSGGYSAPGRRLDSLSDGSRDMPASIEISIKPVVYLVSCRICIIQGIISSEFMALYMILTPLIVWNGR
jgi:hypothetical protein